ncbi:MAG: hypothetical protein U0521_16530 [Anaerolineae bacterium]
MPAPTDNSGQPQATLELTARDVRFLGSREDGGAQGGQGGYDDFGAAPSSRNERHPVLTPNTLSLLGERHQLFTCFKGMQKGSSMTITDFATLILAIATTASLIYISRQVSVTQQTKGEFLLALDDQFEKSNDITLQLINEPGFKPTSTDWIEIFRLMSVFERINIMVEDRIRCGAGGSAAWLSAAQPDRQRRHFAQVMAAGGMAGFH